MDQIIFNELNFTFTCKAHLHFLKCITFGYLYNSNGYSTLLHLPFKNHDTFLFCIVLIFSRLLQDCVT